MNYLFLFFTYLTPKIEDLLNVIKTHTPTPLPRKGEY